MNSRRRRRRRRARPKVNIAGIGGGGGGFVGAVLIRRSEPSKDMGEH